MEKGRKRVENLSWNISIQLTVDRFCQMSEPTKVKQLTKVELKDNSFDFNQKKHFLDILPPTGCLCLSLLVILRSLLLLTMSVL